MLGNEQWRNQTVSLLLNIILHHSLPPHYLSYSWPCMNCSILDHSEVFQCPLVLGKLRICYSTLLLLHFPSHPGAPPQVPTVLSSALFCLHAVHKYHQYMHALPANFFHFHPSSGNNASAHTAGSWTAFRHVISFRLPKSGSPWMSAFLTPCHIPTRTFKPMGFSQPLLLSAVKDSGAFTYVAKALLWEIWHVCWNINEMLRNIKASAKH